MACCLNPNCTQPVNPEGNKYCQHCGSALIALLRNRFKILKPIGKGGFGKTYLAEDTDKLNDRCVVKQLIYQAQGTQANQKIVELFMREAEQLKALRRNQQIPDLLAYFEDSGFLYLVQEFVEGQDLSKELAQKGPFSYSDIKTVLSDLLPILQFVHKQGVIHRDIKPENIMRRQQDGKLVLIDFGVAKEISLTQLTMTGTVVGSPGYSSFEQFKDGKPTAASDLYSLGATCFHLITGQYPGDLWAMQGYGWVSSWQQYLPQATGTEKSTVSKVLDKLLQVKQENRYQTAAEVLADLTPPPPQPPQPPPPPNPPVRQDRRRFLQWITLGGVGLGSVLAWKWIQTAQNSSLQSFVFEVVRVNDRGQITDRSQSQAEFFAADLGNGIPLEMVSIPGGSFEMGSPESESQRDGDEGPQHSVSISPFFMGKYQVTQAQWEAVMGNNPSNFKGADRPVETVSWEEATEFCQRLSQQTGQDYRLPSEAEWEYACRAGTRSPFYFGETITPDIVNYDGNFAYGSGPEGEYREETTPVGSFPPNAFGLHDMHGNVWEWCQDYWHDNYDGAPSDGSAWVTGGDSDRRVLRGGSWYNAPRLCRSAGRSDLNPAFRNFSYGFRVDLSAPRGS